MNRGIWGLLRSLGEMFFRRGATGEEVGPRRRLRLDDTATVSFALADNPDNDEAIVTAAVGDLSGTYAPTLHTHDAGAIVSGALALDRGGLGTSVLSDPNADRILFWDDSAGHFDWLTVGSGNTINGTDLTGWLFDGDKGDITISGSGAAYTIDAGVVTYAKIQNVSATDKVLGRATAGAGSVEEIACTAAARSILDDASTSDMRTTLGVAIGTDVQAWDTLLDSVAALADPNADRILFWDDSAGAMQWLTLGAGLSITGTTIDATSLADGDKGDITVSASGATWTIDAGAVTDTKFRDSAALSLVGRATNTTGSVADIVAGSDGSVLKRSGTTLAFGSVETASIEAAAVTFNRFQNVSTATLIGRTVAGSGSVQQITLGAGLEFGTAELRVADAGITFAKIQDIATDRLVGRDTAATGDVEELTVGGGIEFTGSGGIQRSALTGDVTASAGSNSTTVVAASDSAAGKIEIAVQSEMEAGSDTTRAVVPGRQHYHPSACKVWAQYDSTTATPTLNSSYGVSSLTDTGTGTITVNFSTSFSSANYAAIASGGSNSADNAAAFVACYPNSAKAAGSVRVTTYDGTFSSPVDMKNVCLMCFGDQ